MMFYTKLMILCLVLLMGGISLREGKVPYFPIEISRLAQSSPINNLLFPISILLLPFAMSICGEWHSKYFTALLGLFILALFDDKKAWFLHMIGVLVMIIGAFYSILVSYDAGPRFILLVCSIIIYLTRIVLKVLIVVILESKIYSFQHIFTKSIDIMYYGPVECAYPQYTIPIFQLGGILQWMVFYLILVAIE